jgi:hypothetical protein
MGKTANFAFEKLSDSRVIEPGYFNSFLDAVDTEITGLLSFDAAYPSQGVPAAKTETAAITAAELAGRLITATGETAPSVHQLPTGTLLAAEFPNIAVGNYFDFYVINTGTGAADDVTLTVNTNVTIVGNPTIGSLVDATEDTGSAHFRARYSAANTFVVYRLS